MNQSGEKKLKMKAVHDYQAADQSQLSLKVGDIVTVLKKDAGAGWWAGELNGQVGYFPPSYVGPIGGTKKSKGSFRSVNTVKTKGGTRVKAPSNKAPKPRDPGFQCRAIWSYDAVDPKEISFKEGDVLFILNKDDSGWWEAMVNGERGLVPGNYLKVI